MLPTRSTRFIQKSLLLLLTLATALAASAAEKTLSPAEQAKLLQSILDRTAQAAAAGKSPAAAFDIDDTLMRTSPRTKAIILEFAGKHGERFPGLLERVSRLDPLTGPHGIVPTLEFLGITTDEQKTEIKKYWLPRFLGNDYLTFDWPIPGALAFVQALREKGATIYYITARSPERMMEGTKKALVHFGFPLDARAILAMNDTHKPAPEFKGKRTEAIGKTHELTGLFENEPDNLNAMHRAATAAQAVFIDTVKSPAAGPVDSGIPWIKDYKR